MDETRRRELLERCEGGTPEEQLDAVEELVAMRSIDAVPELLALLTRSPTDVQVAIAEGMEDLGRERIDEVGPALAALLNSDEELVRNAAADVLGRLGYWPAADRLIDTLARDPSPLVRASCAESLGDFGDRAALPALRAALGDEDAAVRGYAANSIGLVGDAQDLPVLERALASEPTAEARAEIHGARYRLGAADGLDGLLGLLGAADELTIINMLNVLDDLITRKSPANLAVDAPRISEAVRASAERFAILKGQTTPLLERLAKR